MRQHRYLLSIMLALLALVVSAGGSALAHASATNGDWASYLFANSRDGFNASETTINQTTAPHLKLHWHYHVGGPIATQPIAANGMVYFGAWDGYEYALTLSGTLVWKTFIGITPATTCRPTTGPVSTATVATMTINGSATPVLFAGGGNHIFYALNASTGAQIWSQPLGTSNHYFIWSSPALYNGNIYIGVSAILDCLAVPGQLVELSAANGSVEHVFTTVPAGCVGASVWGSPAIDETAGTVYFGTGNPGACSTKEPYSEALVELNASDLSLVAAWQVPQRPYDLDFGSTPTLFTATIGGVLHQMVGILNKNGKYYALDRANVAAGPVWTAQIVLKGESLAPAAWDGTQLIAAGGNITLNGVACKGSIRSLNPATGATHWVRCITSGAVVGAVSMVPGLAVVGAGSDVLIYATSGTSSGKLLFTYVEGGGSSINAAATISNGVLYGASFNHYVYAIGI